MYAREDICDPIDDVDNQTVDATTAKDFTAPAGAKGFFISVRTANIYITFDGTTPSATNGIAVAFGVNAVYFPIAKSFKAFGSAASCPTAVLWVR